MFLPKIANVAVQPKGLSRSAAEPFCKYSFPLLAAALRGLTCRVTVTGLDGQRSQSILDRDIFFSCMKMGTT